MNKSKNYLFLYFERSHRGDEGEVEVAVVTMAVDSVILGLNNDLWMQILEFADPFSVANFACVSRRTRQICTTKLSCWSEVSLPQTAMEGHLVLLSRACPKLKRLSLHKAKNAATPRALRASLAKLGDLRELDLSHCRNVKDGEKRES